MTSYFQFLPSSNYMSSRFLIIAFYTLYSQPILLRMAIQLFIWQCLYTDQCRFQQRLFNRAVISEKLLFHGLLRTSQPMRLRMWIHIQICSHKDYIRFRIYSRIGSLLYIHMFKHATFSVSVSPNCWWKLKLIKVEKQLIIYSM